MKESIYNVYLLDGKEQKALVYNTMQRAIVRIDHEVYSLIKEKKIDKIDNKFLEILKNEKIVVDDNMNEMDMLKIMFNRTKYNSNSTVFTIIPTHACNLACEYCYQGHGDVLSHTMNEETTKRTVEFIKRKVKGNKNLALNFYGGEPLLFPDMLFNIIEELKRFADENNMRFSCSLTSNGTLFTEEIAENLKHYNHEVQITFAGPKEIHDSKRVDKKGNGTYEVLMDTISLFKNHHISFHLRVDVDKESYGAMNVFLDDLEERGFKGVFINFCPIHKDVCYTELELDDDKVDPSSLARLHKMAHDRGFRTNPIYIHNFIEGCSAVLDNFFAIDPKGDVFKCMAAPNYVEHRLGSIDENGELSNINYGAYCEWTLRDPLCIEKCRECKFAPICGGGCALTAFEKHGNINAPGCGTENLGDIVRTYIMQKYPELFERCRYESIIL